MRFLDLLTMSINNLRRRKVRTALTVLGVVIGTASVVVMVSLGIGLNALMMEMYSSYGSMTAIEIYNYGNNGNNGTNDNPLYLTDDTVKHFTLSVQVLHQFFHGRKRPDQILSLLYVLQHRPCFFIRNLHNAAEQIYKFLQLLFRHAVQNFHCSFFGTHTYDLRFHVKWRAFFGFSIA